MLKKARLFQNMFLKFNMAQEYNIVFNWFKEIWSINFRPEIFPVRHPILQYIFDSLLDLVAAWPVIPPACNKVSQSPSDISQHFLLQPVLYFPTVIQSERKHYICQRNKPFNVFIFLILAILYMIFNLQC